MKLFVSKSDRIEIEVFVYESDKIIEAVIDKNEIPKEVEPQILKFVFRKPSYEDSRAIFSASQINSGGEDIRVDPIALQNSVLKRLLVDWNIKNDDGTPVECNAKAISSLLPSIARAAAAGILAQGQI